MADDDDLRAEQRHLDRTWIAYEAVLRELSGERTGGIDEFALEALELMRREHLRRYTESSGPLYFGRIDEASGRSLHIGRHAIADEHNELLAINWRAPAAEPFYAATPADRRGVVRRRRLDIEERRVLGLVDETLAAADGDDVLTGSIIEDITRQRVGEMRQIISTITPEQYELISERIEGPLVIQGGPGTGKTAVGLHRAAWLLYSDPGLQRTGVLVVGPNDVFIAYISQVLPSLGETSVEQRSADSLAPARGERVAEPADVATLKGSGRMAQLLRALLWDRVAPPEEPVEIEVGRTTVTVRPQDVAAIVDAARERFRGYERARGRFREQLAGWIASRALERMRGAFAVSHEEAVSLVRKAKAHQRLVSGTWPRVTADQLFAALFRRPRLEGVAAGLLDPGELDLLVACKPPAARTLRASDVPLLDEARWLVDPELRTYGHVVVDEAQNLTPMELRMVVRRARGQSMTILGDIAQRTSDAELESWEEVLDAAGAEHHEVRDLLVSYRVPDDFLRVAATVAPGGAPNAPRGVRSAPWPAVAIRTGALAETVRALAARIGEVVGSVAVVVADAERAALAGAALRDAESAGHLSGRIDLLTLRSVKGLEFDAVIVVEPAHILAARPDGGPGGLYTALTRSTRALAIVHADPLPPALDAAPDLHRIGPDGVADWLRRG